MNYSYVMGINNIDELKNYGFKIKPYNNNYGVSFPDNQITIFEKYISKNLKAGFWNEYLGKEKVFIFKYKDDTIKKYVLNNSNENEILALCREFANYNFNSLDSMLKENEFYASTYYSK